MMHHKLEQLKDIIKGCGSLAVAFSGGVDSTFLLYVAHEVLGDKAVAVTSVTTVFPRREKDEASSFCKEHGIRQIEVTFDELEVPGFADNPPDRCYLCKKALFTNMMNVCRREGIDHIAEGSNTDDNGDYRPGLKAIAELGVLSPLREAGLTKSEIRELSREFGLPTWDKPSYACLASRFPYHSKITADKLYMVEKAEDYLIGIGLRQVRVRVHDKAARIEVPVESFDVVMSRREEVLSVLTGFGFLYVSLDLGGYKTGSLNRGL